MKRRGAAAIALLLAASACGGDASGTGALLTDPRLQSVVALQEARDAVALEERLGDRDPAVRARAAFALGSVQDPRPTNELVERLADDFASVRGEAAFALGQLPQSSRAVETTLIDLLAREQDAVVRSRAVDALGKVGAAAASDVLAVLDPVGPMAPEATLALARLVARGVASPAALDTVLSRLTHPDGSAREAAAWGLANAFQVGGWREKRARVYAVLDVYPGDEAAAANLLRALSKLDEPDARRRTVAWLSDSPSWRNRAAAAESLVGDTLAPDRAALIAALDDSSAHVRATVAAVLGAARLRPAELDRIAAWVAAHRDDALTTSALMAPLAAGGRDRLVLDWAGGVPRENATLRRRAVEAAALLASPESLRFLADAAADPVRGVSGGAVRALAVVWASGGRDQEALRPLFFDAFVTALGAHDPITEPILREMLRDPILIAMGSADAVAAAGPEPDPPPSPVPPLDWAFLGEIGLRPRLVLETPRGRIVVEMYTDEAPLTVQTVARLAREGRYDGVPFHRVVANFMAQGGDVDRGDGMGEPGFHLPSELTHLRFERGTAGVARTDKDTESSQFFLTHSLQAHLDGAYGAFGRVVEGQDAVDALLEGDVITEASVEPGASSPAP